MQRAILHVGMHKTGTTSLQVSLWKARNVLLEHGYLYPKIPISHSVGITNAFSMNSRGHQVLRRRGFVDPEARRLIADRDRASLRRQMQEHSGEGAIISGEDIATLTESETAELHGFLGDYAKRIEVVFLLRPPASYVRSQIPEAIKNGRPLARAFSQRREIPYRDRFEKYLRLLPRNAIHPGIFSRDTLVNGCGVASVLHLAGLGSLAPLIEVHRKNESLSQPAVERLALANKIIPATLPDGRRNPERATKLVAELASMPGPRFQVPRSVLARAVEASREQAEWVRQAFGLDLAAHDDPLSEMSDEESNLQQPDPNSDIATEVLELNRVLLAAEKEASTAPTGRIPAARA